MASRWGSWKPRLWLVLSLWKKLERYILSTFGTHSPFSSSVEASQAEGCRSWLYPDRVVWSLDSCPVGIKQQMGSAG